MHFEIPTGLAIVAYAFSAQGAQATSVTPLPPLPLPPPLLTEFDPSALAPAPSGKLVVLALFNLAEPGGHRQRPLTRSGWTGPLVLHATQAPPALPLPLGDAHWAQPTSDAAHELPPDLAAAAAAFLPAVGIRQLAMDDGCNV